MGTLAEYVRGRASAGLSRAQIIEELTAVGWSPEQAEAAYREGLAALGIPLPEAAPGPPPPRRATAVDVALNLFSFILLGIAATSLGALWFRIIDKSFPDPLTPLTPARELAITGAVHYAIAALIIAFPLYLASMWSWFRRFRMDPARRESRLTRWLTYVVLLIASVTAVGDLIAVLFRLLQGEITARFLLKGATVLVITGVIFAFYFLERRRVQYEHPVGAKALRTLAGMVTALVVAGITVGFVTTGSPELARQQAFDSRRVADLARLSGCIAGYAREFGRLPASLETLARTARYTHCGASLRDPRSGALYEYRVATASGTTGEMREGRYTLCAVFARPAPGGTRPSGEPGLTAWNEHGAGRVCHTLSVALGHRGDSALVPGTAGGSRAAGLQ